MEPNARAQITLKVGESFDVAAMAVNATGQHVPTGQVQWTSTVPSVVSVSPRGLVTALAPGTADITAVAAGLSAEISVTVVAPAPPPVPPFQGTVFIAGGLFAPTDPTAFVELQAAGTGSRQMFDRRQDQWITVDAYLFDASFDDGLTAEIQLHPEFDSVEEAQAQAERFAPIIGRMPTALRQDMRTVAIQKGLQAFGGSNNNLLIYVDQADEYASNGVLEEAMVHELAHTSLDAVHATSSGWTSAQTDDGAFISTYARANPVREDVAESFLPYIAIRYRADRISPSVAATIESTIPHRIAYFDAQAFDVHPVV